jgi:methyl-accepting chemotaxis protein
MKRSSDLSVGVRLGLGFAAAAALLVATGAVGYRATTGLGASVVDVDETSAAASLAQELKFQAADLNGWQTAYALDLALGKPDAAADTATSRAAFLASAERFAELLAELQSLDLVAEMEDDTKTVAADFEEFMAIDDRVIAGYRLGTPEAQAASNQLVLGDAIESFTAMSTVIDEMATDSIALADAEVATARNEASSARTLILAVVLVALALAVVLAVAITRSITNPLEKLRSRLAEIADGDGDLTARLDESRGDEMGRVGAAFNRFVEKVAAAVRAITDHAVVISSSSEELSAVSRQLAGNADQTAGAAASSSNTALNVASSAHTVAAATEEMTAVISEIARSATEAANVAGRAMRVANQAQDVVNRLGASSDQIDDVAKMIGGIAEQTNLLALNATIEAARAGEAGRGFAVVATEVKDLASRSGLATADISKQVAVIQSDVQAAVAAISEIVEVIGLIHENQSTVAAAVQEQSATTDEISRNIVDVASGAEQITSDIESVSHAAQEASQGASETQSAAVELSRLSGDLRHLVGQFKV